MAWTPDEHLLVVSNPDQINFYDVYSRQILRSLYPITKDVVQIAFNPTGNWLVSGSRRGSDEEGYASGLELWYGPDWKPLGGLYGATRALSDLTFSPDGDFMAVAYASSIEEQNGVDFWNTLTWTISSTLQTGIVLNVAFSPDGSYFASSPDRYAIHIWDLKEDQFLRNLHTSFTGAVNDMTFSPDGSLLATGHYDGTIRLWDVQTGSEVLLIRSDAVIQSLAFSPDGRLLASGSSYENSLVNLWSAGSGELLRALEGHENGVSHLLFAPSSQYLVSASYDGTILLWGIRP